MLLKQCQKSLSKLNDRYSFYHPLLFINTIVINTNVVVRIHGMVSGKWCYYLMCCGTSNLLESLTLCRGIFMCSQKQARLCFN